ncbi:ribosome biogenesis GTP-binding protein YihA/YsxC [Eubacteriaceae bacterium ES2]|nr:ribosome biogenesis GTP-binding protein YihA/YsxC [Eubacteriaceae bacterium ES2]
MNVSKAEIIISAVSQAQYPQDDLPEIVLLGRSNVGKSSFINTLIRRKALARTSSQPGKTQTMNFYRINEQFYFVDMPGYGYAKVSKKEREKWGMMIEEYLRERKNIVQIFQLIDSRHQPSEDDRLMYDWLCYYGLDPIVVATKSDKISKNDATKALKKIRNTLSASQQQKVILFSAETLLGKEEAWKCIEEQL